ncbi:MAG: trypsin-like peptidase domain-containing protein [Isosphaeraceae bacterium]
MILLATLAGLAPEASATARAQDAPGPAEAAIPTAELIERAKQSVVLITVENSRGEKVALGSGFLIDPSGLVATNHHVLRMADKARVQFRDGSKAEIKGIRATDDKADLVIVELEKTPPSTRPLPLGPKDPPRPGDAVTAIGHPRGLDFSATRGIVSAIRDTKELGSGLEKTKPEDSRVWVQTDAVIAGGSSGGPLLSEGGRVLGVNTIMIPGQGISFAIHVRHLSALLEKALKEKIKKLPGDLAAAQENPLAPLRPRIRALYEEYQNAFREFENELQNAQSRLQYQVVLRNQNPGPKYAARFLKIAGDEKLTTTSFQALYLACVLDTPDGPAASLKKGIERLKRDHLRDKGLIHALPQLSGQDHEDVRGLLRTAMEQSPHREVKGVACLYLASALRGRPKSDEAQVLGLLKRCTGEFGDITLGDGALADFARPMIFEIEHLSVGKPAPEISGSDASGKAFKLSDYRGKVVILDFFADWCPYCVRMYPEERDLVKSMAGKPFAILGVNADGRDTLQNILDDKKVTWPCWADGKGGPIAEEWQVGSYPTMYVLDQNGIIREKFVGMTQPGVLRKAVEKLVNAVRSTGKKDPAKPLAASTATKAAAKPAAGKPKQEAAPGAAARKKESTSGPGSR